MNYKRYRNYNDKRRHTPNVFLNGDDGRPLRHWEIYERLGLNQEQVSCTNIC